MGSFDEKMKRAVLWDVVDGGKVGCFLCNHRCVIGECKFGYCGIRKNIGGELYSLNYDKVCAANSDPIEKKPLFHFLPGSSSFSIACMGCNFRCSFCQNWQISQAAFDGGSIEGGAISPEKIVESAVKAGCESVAYTYTEPTIFMELCADCGRLAKDRGLSNVFVSNGYMTREAIDFTSEWLDGINVDLKAFTEVFYRNFCKASLGPVLETIGYIAKETDIWLEVTTLLIPGENDSDEELKRLVDFMVSNVGVDVPWHVSRFIPSYHYLDSQATSLESVDRAIKIGESGGLRYIYPGNVPGVEGESSFCYDCGKKLIERRGYRLVGNFIKDGCCPDCGAEIAGRW